MDAASEGSDAASARQGLAELEARGARGYDAPACDCVHALLMRADELGGGIAVRLALRAQAHLSSLRARFDADRARVAERLEAYEAERGEQTALRSVLASGDLVRVARRVRRLRAAPAASFCSRAEARASTFCSRDARASTGRTLALKQPAPFCSRAEPRASTIGFASAAALRRKRVTFYEDSVAQMVATLAMARATDVVPEAAGPYNPLRVASELLERMRAISPFYLAVQLNRLEELGSLLSLPELPESEHPKGHLLQQAEAQKKQKKARLKR